MIWLIIDSLFQTDLFIWPSAAHLSFYYGLYGILQEPGKNAQTRIKIYKVSQLFICILWFCFAIMADGSYNGWVKMKRFSQCKEINPDNTFGFSTFLAVIENMLYYAAIGLGLFCIHKIHTDPSSLDDPFEEVDNRQGQQSDAEQISAQNNNQMPASGRTSETISQNTDN